MSEQEMTIEQAKAQLEFQAETVKSLAEKLANKEIESSQLTTLVNRLGAQAQQANAPQQPSEMTDDDDLEDALSS